jgi:DNA-binding GntR family transcriptional regulator
MPEPQPASSPEPTSQPESEPQPATRSQSEIVYDQVRQAILSLDIVPGATLSERGLESEFGASRTPVRAALIRLQGDGLVSRDGRAWQATPIDLGVVRALTEYRSAVEAAAVRMACARASDDDIAAFAAAARDDSPVDENAGIVRGDTFHGGVAELSGNPFIVEAVRSAVTRMARARWLELRSADDRAQAWREHADIIDALLRRDADAAAAASERHASANLERLLTSLRNDRRAFGARGLRIVGE